MSWINKSKAVAVMCFIKNAGFNSFFAEGVQSNDSDYEFDGDDGKSLEETIASLTIELGLDKQIKDGLKHLDTKLKSFEGKNNWEGVCPGHQTQGL